MESPLVFFQFNETEKKLIRKMLELGVDSEVLRKIVAFWLWLESQGLKDTIKKIGLQCEKTVALVCLEAETAITALENHNSQLHSSSKICLQFTGNIVSNGSSVNLEGFFEDKAKAWSGFLQVLNEVCGIVLNGILGDQKNDQGRITFKLVEIVQKLFQPSNYGGSEVRPSISSGLNPMAREWRPDPEEKRSLYITFSHGFPLSPSEIHVYFSGMYGDFVESVYVHQPRDRAVLPQFGRILFKEAWFREWILMGKEEVRFHIFGKPLFCKRFISKDHRSSSSRANPN